MPRAIWTGVMQFVLISIPVKLYKATDDKGINFRTLHNICGSGIHLKKWCEKCGKEVLPTEIDKGYEVAKGQFVIFKEDEIENALPESSKIIKIEKAVPADEIPTITYEDSYFLTPEKGGEHVYNLLFNALSLKPKLLIGRVVIRNKEHLVAIRPYSDGFLMSMLHFADEVRDIHEVVVLKEKKVDQKELDLAISLLDNLTGSFGDIDQRDIFREYIEKIAELKATGQVVTIEEKKPISTTVGLVEALQRSIEMSKAGTGQGLAVEIRADKKIPTPSIKQQMDQMYGVTEEEINKLILERKIEDEQERLKVLVELQKYASFEDYVKVHKQEFEEIEVSTDFSTITIADDKYPRINLDILKKIGIVADHFGLLIFIKSSKKAVVPKIRESDLLKIS
jgi:DNA end-binding protein Ku